MSRALVVRFDDAQWRRANDGRAPRGIGSWAFDFGRGPEWAPGAMTFGEAKKWARTYARDRFAHLLQLGLASRLVIVTVCS